MGTHSADLPPWAAALGRIPSGLFVLTAAHGGQETGMLASWVQQCSFDPPMVSVAVRKGRPLLEWLTDGAAFAVNVIGEGQKNFVAHFGKGFDPGEPAFTGLDVDRSGGAPVLTAALAHLHLRAAGRLDAGDHVIVLGRVVGGAASHDGRPTVHVRKSGLHY
jgi:flavin reductase (DIM6/NTAB) family NADH-FMN oxidoreductase RutF